MQSNKITIIMLNFRMLSGRPVTSQKVRANEKKSRLLKIVMLPISYEHNNPFSKNT